MAYETKALLSLLADAAILTESKQMYKLILKMANVEGVVLKPYEEAKQEMMTDE